jgi:hypothetical protein
VGGEGLRRRLEEQPCSDVIRRRLGATRGQRSGATRRRNPGSSTLIRSAATPPHPTPTVPSSSRASAPPLFLACVAATPSSSHILASPMISIKVEMKLELLPLRRSDLHLRGSIYQASVRVDVWPWWWWCGAPFVAGEDLPNLCKGTEAGTGIRWRHCPRHPRLCRQPSAEAGRRSTPRRRPIRCGRLSTASVTAPPGAPTSSAASSRTTR